MINITIDITPENGDEEHLVITSISIIRSDITNNNMQCKYRYGGSWRNREGELSFVSGSVWGRRESAIFVLIENIMKDIRNQLKG